MPAQFDMRMTLKSGAVTDTVAITGRGAAGDPQRALFHDLLKKWLRDKTGYLQDFQGFIETEGKAILAETIEEIFKTRAYGTWPVRKPPPRSHPLLRLTDAYYNALLATIPRAHQHANRIDYHSFRFALDMSQFETPYPLFHEYGTWKLPARPVLSFLVTNARFIKRYTTAYDRWSRKHLEAQTKQEIGASTKTQFVYPFTSARLSRGATVRSGQTAASSRYANRGRRRGATKRKIAGTARGGRPRKAPLGAQQPQGTQAESITRRPGEDPMQFIHRKRFHEERQERKAEVEKNKRRMGIN